ncbi:MAG: sigma-E factor negative regulatory protein, partial [Pseudoxanthomonas sp.]
MNRDIDTDHKLQLHFNQQLSELLDGELAPDQARFLLRRLEHDDELGATFERWQLCGDVLRGRMPAPAPAGFAARVSAAIAAGDTRPVKAANDEVPAAPAARARLARWGS